KFFALMAMLIVLSLSLWCFAVAETLTHSAKFALAAGGLIFFILGFGAALLIDNGASPGDIGALVNTLSWVTAGLVVAGVVALVVLSLMRRGTRLPAEATAEAKESVGEERFKQLATVLIASATVLAAVLAYLQSDSDDKAGDAARDAQRYAAQSLGI